MPFWRCSHPCAVHGVACTQAGLPRVQSVHATPIVPFGEISFSKYSTPMSHDTTDFALQSLSFSVHVGTFHLIPIFVFSLPV